MLHEVLEHLDHNPVIPYFDDACIISKTFEQHVEHIENVLTVIGEKGLILQTYRCQILQNSCNFVGHKVSDKDIEPIVDHVKAIKII